MHVLFAILFGTLAGGIIVGGVESLGMLVISPPELTVDPLTDPEAAAAWMGTVPLSAKLVVVVAWALGAFTGGVVAAKTAPEKALVAALGVGVLHQLLGLMNLLVIPHPTWMWVGSFALVIPAAWLGAVLAPHIVLPEGDPGEPPA